MAEVYKILVCAYYFYTFHYLWKDVEMTLYQRWCKESFSDELWNVDVYVIRHNTIKS